MDSVRVQWTGIVRRALVALLILLAFTLRTHRLEVQSLWYDEAVTAQIAERGLGELTSWTAGDIQPPLYYYVVAGWSRVAGRGEWALRFPSAFFGALTVALCGPRPAGSSQAVLPAESRPRPAPRWPRSRRSSFTIRKKRACTRC